MLSFTDAIESSSKLWHVNLLLSKLPEGVINDDKSKKKRSAIIGKLLTRIDCDDWIRDSCALYADNNQSINEHCRKHFVCLHIDDDFTVKLLWMELKGVIWKFWH